MGEYVQITLIVAVTKVLQLLVGLALGHFGYSLFRRGVYERAGDLRASSH